ncbi:MAG: DUF1738 domain-containing protein, partial [Sulfitobacter sp.]|nr:DUF1738 domain-containing protein [Sulfitobacter sp.]
MVDPRSQAESSARNSTPPGTAKPQIPAGTADSQPSQSCIRCNIGGSGANVITLAIEALDHGYPTGEWATYTQWTDHGAQVRKGERSAQVIKWVTRKTQADDRPAADGESRDVRQLLPRVYAVFNAHQVDGYDTQLSTAPATPATEWFASIGADVHYGSDRAYYDPHTDRIYVPAGEQFDDLEAFHATNLHEHIHWTGHGSRLDRLHVDKPMDSPEYAAEELVAELGAAIGCARLGISPTPRPDHAAYLAHYVDGRVMWSRPGAPGGWWASGLVGPHNQRFSRNARRASGGL